MLKIDDIVPGTLININLEFDSNKAAKALVDKTNCDIVLVLKHLQRFRTLCLCGDGSFAEVMLDPHDEIIT